jgi:hypothetical protein
MECGAWLVETGYLEGRLIRSQKGLRFRVKIVNTILRVFPQDNLFRRDLSRSFWPCGENSFASCIEP